MNIDYSVIIISLINIVLLIVIILGLYKAYRGIRDFIIGNKEMNKKVDIILNKLNDKNDN